MHLERLGVWAGSRHDVKRVIQGKLMIESKIKQTLIEKRAMHYSDFTGSLKLIKKKILEIEDRITRDGDAINFSANSDFLEDATALWKASHRLYQIDALLAILQDDAQKLTVPPQNEPV